MSTLTAVRADAVREALDNFTVLLPELDAGRALRLLGIGRLQFRRRARLLAEWRGLCMALWRLALQRSFPEDAGSMFCRFRESFGQRHADRTTALALERAPVYWQVLSEGGTRISVPRPARWQPSFLRTRPGRRPWPCV